MIEIQNLTKSYRVKNGRHYVFRNVSAVFPEGANIGIIGPNGGGKSTFLRILGGIDYPDSGRINSNQSFSWPLGLRGAFVGHLSGRENCRMICNLYGLGVRETRRQLEIIKELSGIGAYFEEPVKHYSSGMGSRLGFSLSMSFDFDYFLIDEITAVGDARFKSLAKEALRQKAQTSKVIMVTHNMGDIKKFCDVGVVLNHGQLTVYTDLDEAIRAYLPKTEESEEDLEIINREAKLDEIELGSVALPDQVHSAVKELSNHLASIEEKMATTGHSIRGNEAVVCTRLAEIYSTLGNNTKAEHWFQQAVAANEFHLPAILGMATMSARKDDRDATLKWVTRAADLDPKNPRMLQLRIQIHTRMERLEEAARDLETALRLNPKRVDLWVMKARILQRKGDTDGAMDAQIKAISLNPDEPSYYNAIGDLLAESDAIEPSVLARYKATLLPGKKPQTNYRNLAAKAKRIDNQISA